MRRVLHIHPDDNVAVALQDLAKGENISVAGFNLSTQEPIKAKHKIALKAIGIGERITMYGVLVGKATQDIAVGALLHVFNVSHDAEAYVVESVKSDWQTPDLRRIKNRKFQGYPRKDGSVGTANYWIVLPLVFCENRNLEVMQKALVDDLGYGFSNKYKNLTQKLIEEYKQGAGNAELLEIPTIEAVENKAERVFPNVDGVKFLTHEMGCGGTREDARSLCGLLAGYITHPNVAGATVLSLGCENAQTKILKEELDKRGWSQALKTVFFLEQQKEGTEEAMVAKAIKQTFTGLIEANKIHRKTADLRHLSLGLECGGSDGFSGISANPALGVVSDLLVGLGGTTVLSEFPELCGAEQELINRCKSTELAAKFRDLMLSYGARAEAVGSGFDKNPSPGNIKDGLITDAMKSAGAAKKGGSSPINDVLDYPQKVREEGLNLLCTPGNDVESTTAMVGAGCNIVVFTTGLGTPTGNPIAPVIKLASNSALAQKMGDIIDLDAGDIISGQKTIETMGEELLDYIIKVASGETIAKAVKNGQDDFIPWKRGVSL